MFQHLSSLVQHQQIEMRFIMKVKENKFYISVRISIPSASQDAKHHDTQQRRDFSIYFVWQQNEIFQFERKP